MKSDRKALLALLGAIVAGAGVGYGTGALDPLLGRGEPPATATTANKAEQPEAAADKQPAAAAKTGQQEQPDVAALPAAKDAAAAPAVAVPSFDLLRVEPSGDVVIAGTAAPGSALEIVSGSDVLAKVQAGTAGDFAAVLDEPLKPGDYQIVLRATGTDGTVVNSTGTAIVSVPETEKGEVLALVEEPGKASRLISTTGSVGDGDNAAAGSQAKPAGEKPAETAQAEPAPADASGSKPAEGPAAEAPKEEQVAKAEPAAPADSQAGKPAEPAAKAPEVAIEAVEIEGDKVFVAGKAEPGQTVRVYANDILLGDAVTSPQGRFLVEATKELAQGDYIVRADMIGKDGAEVLARAAVPFAREPGEAVAAVAPAAEPAKPATATDDGGVPASSATDQPAAGQDGQAAAGNETAASEPSTAANAVPAETAPAALPGETPAATGGEGTAVAVNEPTAPPLQAVDRSVIIRRGDTLWRISRRVYGRGTRYTTIYKANQNQIRNPDMIFPGQTFMVPDKSEDGETADMENLRPQG